MECPQGEAERVGRLLTEEMEGVCQLTVPLIAEAHRGKLREFFRENSAGLDISAL